MARALPAISKALTTKIRVRQSSPSVPTAGPTWGKQVPSLLPLSRSRFRRQTCWLLCASSGSKHQPHIPPPLVRLKRLPLGECHNHITVHLSSTICNFYVQSLRLHSCIPMPMLCHLLLPHHQLKHGLFSFSSFSSPFFPALSPCNLYARLG